MGSVLARFQKWRRTTLVLLKLLYYKYFWLSLKTHLRRGSGGPGKSIRLLDLLHACAYFITIFLASGSCVALALSADNGTVMLA